VGSSTFLLAAELLDQVKRLKHEPDVTQPGAREAPRTLRCELVAGEHDPPRVGPVERPEQVQ